MGLAIKKRMTTETRELFPSALAPTYSWLLGESNLIPFFSL